ncbi:GNAT family N-acetyltransferase [Candidatus Bipolaricaulota bacterium]
MITYNTGTDVIDWDSLMQLYCETDGVIGLARAGDLTKIKEGFRNSYRVVTAWEEDRIVGAGRMISDGVCYGWIHDMAVLPDLQKQGIGRGIVEALLDGNERLLVGLTSSFDAVEFYRKLGFKKHKTALAKYPGESIYLED